MSLLALLHLGCLGLVAILLIAAAVQDLRAMNIDNRLPLGIAGLFAIWVAGELAAGRMSFEMLGWAVGCGVAMFALGAAAFAVGALGGGDVKLLAAVSLFAGPPLMVDFLLVTALVGGAIAIAILAGAPIGPAPAPEGATLRARLRGGLPYGPAIVAGGLWVVISLGLG